MPTNLAIQKTRRRRLTFLAALVVIFAGVVAGLYAFRQHQHLTQRTAAKAAGLVAYQAGDYAQAVDLLGPYIDHTAAPASEVLYAFSQARLKVPEPGHRNLTQAATALRRLVKQDPTYKDAAAQLAQLYLLAGQDRQALAAAGQALKVHPRDAGVLATRAAAYADLSRNDKALAAAQAALAIDPENINMRLLTFRLRHQAGEDPQALLTDAQKLHKKYPKDAGFELVLAYAYNLAGDSSRALRSLKNAAAHAEPKVDLVRQLVHFLNQAGLYSQSLDLLKRTADKTQDAALSRALTIRLFQSGQYKQVADRLSKQKVDTRSVDITLVAYHALALAQMGKTDAARKLNDLLATKKDRPNAISWNHVLTALLPRLAAKQSGASSPPTATPAPSYAALAKICREAIAQDATEPYYHACLAQSDAAMGESELALTQWRDAADLAPTWAAPHLRQAEILLTLSGQHRAALKQAAAAFSRQPQSIEAAAVYLQASAMNLPPSTHAVPAKLQTLADDLTEAAPLNLAVLTARVTLLAHAGQRTAAAQAIRRAVSDKKLFHNSGLGATGGLSARADSPKGARTGGQAASDTRDEAGSKPALTESSLLALASLSDQYHLGVRQACYDAIAAVHGPTPDTALAKATALATSGQPRAGLVFIKKARAAANDKPAGPWQLAWARYLDRIHDPRTAAAWNALAEAYPHNVQIQLAALNGLSTLERASFPKTSSTTQKTNPTNPRARCEVLIQRIHNLTGDQALTWRIEQARWLEKSPKPAQGAAAAISMLQGVITQAPDRLEPRLLLAHAHEMLGQWALAVTALQDAVVAQPDALALRLHLARDQQHTHHFKQAKHNLRHIITAVDATSDQLSQAAACLVSQGDTLDAIAALKRALGDTPTVVTHPALVSSSTEEAGDNAASGQNTSGEDARGEGGGGADGVALLTSLYLQQGRIDQAAALCPRLLKHPTAAGLVLVADVYARQHKSKDTAAALAQLDKLHLPAGRAAMWRGIYQANHHQYAQATASFNHAVVQAPHDPLIWRKAIRFELTVGRAEQAIQTARLAAKKRPGDAAIQALLDNAPAVVALADTSFQPLVLSLMDSPDTRPVAATALNWLNAARQHKEVDQLADRMNKLAAAHRNFLALQNAAARVNMDMDDFATAVDIASIAMRYFPASATPAQLAAQAAANSGDWDAALATAQQWRDRTPATTLTPGNNASGHLAADTMIARAQANLNMPAAAAQTLAPYAKQIFSAPADHHAAIRVYSRALVDSGHADQAADLLAPLLLEPTSRWRLLWMRLATNDMQDPAIAAAWLQRAQPFIPPDALAERIALAQSWWTLAKRDHQPEDLALARQIIDHVAAQPGAPAQAWFLRGMMAEMDHNLNIAEISYRHAVDEDATFAAAKNNLAMVLLHQHRQLAHAQKLAEAAVAAAPRDANYLDTLAQVQAAVGQTKSAITTINRAIKLDPDNLRWQDRLAAIQAVSSVQSLPLVRSTARTTHP